MYVGNMMSGFLQNQEHLGSLMATALGNEGIPSYKVEAACASGGVATNAGVKAIMSGLEEIVLVGAVEKMSGYTYSSRDSRLDDGRRQGGSRCHWGHVRRP